MRMPVAINKLLSAHDTHDVNAAFMRKSSQTVLKTTQMMRKSTQFMQKSTQMACRAARASMIKRFAPPVVAQQIIAKFWRVEKERARREGPAA